jgi:hypothetical protein
MSEPVVQCFRCKKTPEEIPEYQLGKWWDEGDFESPTDYCKKEEGTYNPESKQFACTDCYIAIGMPTSRAGWRAP